MTDQVRYVVNPDVSCREEGPDGALLFNPDTDQVVVVNATGLLIWQALIEPSTREEIVQYIQERCEGVPTDEVTQDVREFIDELVAKGFVGTYQGVTA
ncbi:MAG: PqqD family protein [Anaerolineae bacterium]|jgi:hypothetical protein